MPRLRESLTVLRQRDFRLLFAGQAVSVFGDRMVSIALAFAVLELGGSPTEVGLVLACRTLPQVACLPVGGVVADRVSRRTVMVCADVARLATQGLLAALLIAGAPPLWTVAVLAGLTGAATGFFNPALTGLLPAVVAPEELQQANGLRATAMSGGEILGPAIAGLVVASAGPGWALGIDAATFSVSAALLARMRLPPSAARAPTRSWSTCATAGTNSARGPGSGASSRPPPSRTWCGARGTCSARWSPIVTSAAPRRGARCWLRSAPARWPARC